MLTLRFKQLYQVNVFMNNDVDALLDRIDFVQRTEPRSNYAYNRVCLKNYTLYCSLCCICKLVLRNKFYY